MKSGRLQPRTSTVHHPHTAVYLPLQALPSNSSREEGADFRAICFCAARDLGLALTFFNDWGEDQVNYFKTRRDDDIHISVHTQV